jgi:hypothetical protein
MQTHPATHNATVDMPAMRYRRSFARRTPEKSVQKKCQEKTVKKNMRAFDKNERRSLCRLRNIN